MLNQQEKLYDLFGRFTSERVLTVEKRTYLALKLFKQMAPIPSPTWHEEPMGNYLQNLALEHGLESKKDETGNVVIFIPASKGYEKAKGLCFQMHQDGVPKADEGKPNPAQFGVKPVVKEINRELCLAADGTTLWADNRAGIVGALTLALDAEVIHSKMLLIFTVGEEKDMRGVKNFNIPIDTKEYPVMWNLDSEEEGVICKGSACAGYTDMTIPVERERLSDRDLVQLQVMGTTGDRHSGLDIHKGRVNANKLVAQILDQVMKDGPDLRLLELSDDNFEIVNNTEVSTKNSICRTARATVAVKPEDRGKFESAVRRIAGRMNDENRRNDPDLDITVMQDDRHDGDVFVMTADSTRKTIDTIVELPHGVIKAADGHPDQVLTSTNLAIAKADERDMVLTVSMMTRAASEQDLERVRKEIEAVMTGNVLTLSQSDVMKGWIANEKSGMSEFLSRVYSRLFGKPMIGKVDHAGLESGEFQSLFPDMDIKSIGMNIYNPHGTTEYMSIASFDRFIRFLFAATEAYVKEQ